MKNILTSCDNVDWVFVCHRVCVCVRLIMPKCGPGDTYCSGKYRRSDFERFVRHLYFCPPLGLRTDAATELYSV